MTFLKFFRLIHIHPILIIFIIVSLITGTFVQLFIMLSIVFIHELGHYAAASYYKWRIYSIVLWVFGGVMKTDESNNRKIKEDIIVTVAGPLQHIIIFLLIICLDILNILPPSIISLAHYFNIIIFLFNLLPIYPLDGGKLMFYILSNYLPFRKAHHFTVVFSIVVCCLIIFLQIVILPFTLSAFLLIAFLLFENRKEWVNKYYIFIRFLFNRLNHPSNEMEMEVIHVPEQFRLIDAFSLFKRNKTHKIQLKGSKKSINENYSLYLYFKEKKLTETVGNILRNQ